MSLLAAPQADRAKPSSVIEDAVVNHDAIEDLAETLQQLLRGAEHALPDGVVNLLHGTPLGHPLHPILVHLPLGGWMIAGMLDFSPAPNPRPPSGPPTWR